MEYKYGVMFMKIDYKIYINTKLFELSIQI